MKSHFYKFLVLTTILCVASALKAQNTANTEVKGRKNIIKTNLFAPLSIGYERGLGKHLSISADYMYLSALTYGTPAATTGQVGLDPTSGLSVEGRYYTAKDKAPLCGFFVGGYYSQRASVINMHKLVNYDENTTFDVTAHLPVSLTTTGAMIGWQKVRAKGFTTSFNMGLGYYKISGLPTIASDATANLKLVSQLAERYSGVAPRLSFSLGYGF